MLVVISKVGKEIIVFLGYVLRGLWVIFFCFIFKFRIDGDMLIINFKINRDISIVN